MLEDWPQWVAFEAMANRAFARHDAWVICPYDARFLPDAVLDGM